MFGRKKDPIAGTTRLVGYRELFDDGRTGQVTIRAEVVLEADGIDPTPARAKIVVHRGKLPLHRGYLWRVEVDRANLRRWSIRPDPGRYHGAEVADLRDAQEEAERIAAALRAGRPDSATRPPGLPPLA